MGLVRIGIVGVFDIGGGLFPAATRSSQPFQRPEVAGGYGSNAGVDPDEDPENTHWLEVDKLVKKWAQLARTQKFELPTEFGSVRRIFGASAPTSNFSGESSLWIMTVYQMW